jgi:ornithine cyclodeaminase
MIIVSDSVVRSIASRQMAFEAVRDAFVSAAEGKGVNFPVVIGHGMLQQNQFGCKSGTALERPISGVKIGSYWPDNHLKGRPNHDSTTLLMDNDDGSIWAIVSAGYLNGLRTAAADAVATSLLARPDAAVVGMLGAGHQAEFEVRAVADIRSIESVLIWSRQEARARELAGKLSDLGMPVSPADTETVCRSADILITATPSAQPLFSDPDWIRPGTHISAMGADTPGKQELPVTLVRNGRLFADLPEQSRRIGEFQHIAAAHPGVAIAAIGDVITGSTPGRMSTQDITIFDSSGIALQDLFVAERVVSASLSAKAALEVEFQF